MHYRIMVNVVENANIGGTDVNNKWYKRFLPLGISMFLKMFSPAEQVTLTKKRYGVDMLADKPELVRVPSKNKNVPARIILKFTDNRSYTVTNNTELDFNEITQLKDFIDIYDDLMVAHRMMIIEDNENSRRFGSVFDTSYENTKKYANILGIDLDSNSTLSIQSRVQNFWHDTVPNKIDETIENIPRIMNTLDKFSLIVDQERSQLLDSSKLKYTFNNEIYLSDFKEFIIHCVFKIPDDFIPVLIPKIVIKEGGKNISELHLNGKVYDLNLIVPDLSIIYNGEVLTDKGFLSDKGIHFLQDKLTRFYMLKNLKGYLEANPGESRIDDTAIQFCSYISGIPIPRTEDNLSNYKFLFWREVQNNCKNTEDWDFDLANSLVNLYTAHIVVEEGLPRIENKEDVFSYAVLQELVELAEIECEKLAKEITPD